MDMGIYQLNFIIGILWLLLLSTGCSTGTTYTSANSANREPGSVNGQASGKPSTIMQEVFDAITLRDFGSGTVMIETDLPADITVIAFPSPDIGLDYITQGWGNTEQSAVAEAHKNVAVTLERVSGGAQILARTLTPAADSRDNVKLHVRVPPGTRLVIRLIKGNNVTVSGETVSVDVRTPHGVITVNGAVGPLQLVTEDGSINVDSFAQHPQGQAPRLDLQARNGDINLIGVGANVQASTIGGNIRFVGSLSGSDNLFTTTGNGRVLVTLPDDLTYRFDVENRQRVVNDFMMSTLVCAMATSADTRLSTQMSPDVAIGQIVSSDSDNNITYTFKSMTGRYRDQSQSEKPYLYFQDNHSLVDRYSPDGDRLPNGGNAAQAFWSPGCDTVKQQVDQNTPPPTVGLRIRAENGEVVLRLIRKH